MLKLYSYAMINFIGTFHNGKNDLILSLLTHTGLRTSAGNSIKDWIGDQQCKGSDCKALET